MSHRLLLVGLGAIALGACAVSVEDTAAQMLVDAGQLLQDAGTALDDSNDASAQSDGGAQMARKPRVLQVSCDVERRQGSADTERWAAVSGEDMDQLRSAWTCAEKPVNLFGCPAGACTGPVLPAVTCQQTTAFLGADGQLWLSCGQQWTYARLVFAE